MRILIVGGVAGGATAAARLRRLSEDAEIIVIERGEHISFANCGLPYHIGGTIESRDDLLLETPETFLKKINVEVRNHTEALSIDRENKKILVRDRKNMEDYNMKYDYMILSPGANPFVPPVEGFDKKGVKTLGLKNEINIPFPKLRDRIDSLDKNKTYITYCTMGMRGYFAYRILKLNGFNVKNLNGGFRVYANAKKAEIMLKNS